jgi:hypothetical protein
MSNAFCEVWVKRLKTTSNESDHENKALIADRFLNPQELYVKDSIDLINHMKEEIISLTDFDETALFHHLIRSKTKCDEKNADISYRLNFLVFSSEEVKRNIKKNSATFIIEFFCLRHFIRFKSKSARAYSQAKSHHGGTCPECDLEAGLIQRSPDENSVTSPISILKLNYYIKKCGYDINFDQLSLSSESLCELRKSDAYVPVRCIKPVSAIRPRHGELCLKESQHKIGNLLYLVNHPKADKTINCKGECDSSRSGASGFEGQEKTQQKIDQYFGSDDTYIIESGFTNSQKKCVVRHVRCGIRYRIRPTQLTTGKYSCSACSPTILPRFLVKNLYEFEDLCKWVMKRSGHLLDPDFRSINENTFTEIKEGNLSARNAKFHAVCLQHQHVGGGEAKFLVVASRPHYRQSSRIDKDKCCYFGTKISKDRYYTAQKIICFLSEKMPNIYLDLEKSQISDISYPLRVEHLLYLGCKVEDHGLIDTPLTTYQLNRFLTDSRHGYKTDTICIKCDPFAQREVNFGRIRSYVEDFKRIDGPHRSTFKLISSEDEITKQISQGIQADDIRIEIEQILDETVVDLIDLELRESLTYAEFKNGKGGKARTTANLSYLHRMLLSIFNQLKIEYTPEKTFDDLFSINGHKLRLDFYLKDLGVVIEVDGCQHISEKCQFVLYYKNNKNVDPKASLAQQIANDEIINRYFESKDDVSLLRVQAYNQEDGKITNLSVDESYQAAVRFIEQNQDYFKSIEGLEDLDKETIYRECFSPVIYKKINEFNQRLGLYFTLEKIEIEEDANGRTTYIYNTRCTHCNSPSIIKGTVYNYLLAKAREENAIFCQECRKIAKYQNLIQEIKNRISDIEDSDLKVNNKDELLSAFQDAEEKKDFSLFGSFSIEICNERTGYSRNYRSIQYFMKNCGEIISQVRNVTTFFIVKDNKKRMVRTKKKDSIPKILNYSELKQGSELIISQKNQLQKEHYEPRLQLPEVIWDSFVESNIKLEEITEAFSRRYGNEFKILNTYKNFWEKKNWPKEFIDEYESPVIEVLHVSCGKTSFLSYQTVARAIKVLPGDRVQLCFWQPCLKQQGLKYSGNHLYPIKIEGANRKDIHLEIKSQFKPGQIEIACMPIDVRSSFSIKITDGMRKDTYVRVSSHDNWSRRGTYTQLSLAISGDGTKWPGRSSIYSDSPICI